VSAPVTDQASGARSDEQGDAPVGGRHLARNICIVVAVVLVLFVALLATRSPSEDRFGENPLVGKAVPEISGATTTGSTFDIDAYRGSWVVVNFFATWCTPCILEHPELVRFEERHADGSAQIVSIAYDDSPERVQEFFDDKGGTWPVVVADDARVALDFGVTGVPESFLVAPNGQVVAHFTGVTADGLDDVIRQFEDAATASTGTTP
jgi:cytochrome c biogenesis protein CcmG/thiol:disulfide interchange protein DsbE